MKIVLAYIAVCGGPITDDYIARFVTTWREYPPGVEHDTLVIANGGPLATSANLMLGEMGAKVFVRSNEGWDIQGYLDAARGPCVSYDVMLCLGESCYFHREGWLERLVNAWSRHGPGIYGPFSSNAVTGHLNTTAFMTSPKLLRQYPLKVSTRQERYAFEHGKASFWRRVSRQGNPAMLVTWDGEWEPWRWRMPRNVLWRGDQSNCLFWCNHADGYANANRATKAAWERSADQPFK